MPVMAGASSSAWLGSRDRVRLLAALGLGVVVAIGAFMFGLPGRGEFVPIAWLVGVAAGVVAPGWTGWVALIGGMGGGIVALTIAAGVDPGFVYLVVAILGGLASHGEIVAWTLLRVARLRAAGLRDAATLAGLGLIGAGIVAGTWIAAELARNPP
jgi:hypothetical protein